MLRGFVMLKYGGEVCFSTVGEAKLCHLFARSRGFIEYSYKIIKGGKRKQSISWLPVAQLLKTALFLGFDLKQQPSLLTSEEKKKKLGAQMLPVLYKHENQHGHLMLRSGGGADDYEY